MVIRARGRTLTFEAGPLVVGVVNATPDSFSDTHVDRSTTGAVDRAEGLCEAGADVIEIGGESNVSNHPGVSAEEEIERIIPCIDAAVGWGVPVSVDTHKARVAAAALEHGAVIVNDISGFNDPEMVGLVAATGAATVVVHSEVAPKQSRWDDGLYPAGVVAHVRDSLATSVQRLIEAGVARDAIVLDPGPDFAKTPRQTTSLIGGLGDIVALGYPVMLAASRKDFIGAITSRPPSERLAGSLAAVSAGMLSGVHFLRVHDVAETRDFIKVWRAITGEDPVDPALRVGEEIRREPASSSMSIPAAEKRRN